MYTKKADYSAKTTASSTQASSTSGRAILSSHSSRSNQSSSNSDATGSFDTFKNKLKNNLNGVKKSTKSNSQQNNQRPNEESNAGPAYQSSVQKLLGSAVHIYTEDVRKLDFAHSLVWREASPITLICQHNKLTLLKYI